MSSSKGEMRGGRGLYRDVAKESHWVEVKIAEAGQVLTSCAVADTPPSSGELIEQIRAAEGEHGPVWVDLDSADPTFGANAANTPRTSSHNTNTAGKCLAAHAPNRARPRRGAAHATR